MTLLQLGLMLITAHFQGWRPVDGYTVTNANDPYKGARYLAVAMERAP